ncbi:MAG: cytidylate kinase-like family protein [Candidatus Zixiibacteriota bacterium]
MTSIEALVDRQLRRRALLEQARGVPPHTATPSGPLRVITVSRETGSGGRTLAARLARRLNFEFVDRQILDLLIENTGARERLIASLDERTRSGIDLWVEGILTGRYVDRSEYRHLLAQTITTLAEHGDAVILGRAANVILRGRGGLHVRVVAPRAQRIDNLVGPGHLVPAEAEKRVTRMDDERRRFYAQGFGADIDNARDYHLVINSGQMPLDAAEALILLAWDRYLGAV